MNIKARKSLGQNFLKSKKVLQKIVDVSDITENEIVLEIGPGKGALTEKLLEKATKVIAIEKDKRLLEFLKEKFWEEIKDGRLDLINQDILDFDETTLSFYKFPYKIVANIPYYITGQIIEKFLSSKIKPKSMTLLVQKEVADRIVARDKKESILSIAVKVFGTPKYICKVSKKDFSPAPKVDSAVLLINDISNKNFDEIKEEDFFSILKSGFAHKRKVLVSNLNKIFKDKNNNATEKLSICNLDPKVRAENLKVEDWICLSK